jgi:hypothetical protein
MKALQSHLSFHVVILKTVVSLCLEGHFFFFTFFPLNYHYNRDIMEMSEIKVEFIPSIKLIADHMTNGLPLKNSESM